MFSVTVNGLSHQFDQSLTIAQLLDELVLGGRRIAVEQNGAIVPRSRFSAARIEDGDRLEIVVAVGGG